MSRTNQTKNKKWHETCKCECRLDAILIGILLIANANVTNHVILVSA